MALTGYWIRRIVVLLFFFGKTYPCPGNWVSYRDGSWLQINELNFSADSYRML